MIDPSYLSPNGRLMDCFLSANLNLLPYERLPINKAIAAILGDHLPYFVEVVDDTAKDDQLWEWLYENVSAAWRETILWNGALKIHFEEEHDAVAFQLIRD